MASKVKLVLRPGVHARIDGVDYGPGDTVEVDPAVDNLVENGLADREGDESRAKADAKQSKVEAEARDAAEEIEASKARGVEQTNAERIVPARGRRSS